MSCGARRKASFLFYDRRGDGMILDLLLYGSDVS